MKRAGYVSSHHASHSLDMQTIFSLSTYYRKKLFQPLFDLSFNCIQKQNSEQVFLDMGAAVISGHILMKQLNCG